MNDMTKQFLVRAESNKGGYLPSLDGWRAVAIILVISYHDAIFSVNPPRIFTFASWAVGDPGVLGVRLFFAISGLLICSRLLEEENKLGAVRLRGFYVRRFFRIQPAALAYLAVVALLGFWGLIQVRWQLLVAALLSYINFIYRVADPTGQFVFVGHFWTLAVEEQFYIILSLIFIYCKKRRILSFAVVLLALIIFQRYAIRIGMFSFSISTRRTYWTIQFFIVPVLLTLFLQIQPIYRRVLQWLHPWVAYLTTLIACALWGIHRAHSGEAWIIHGFYVGENGVMPYCFGLWLVSTITHPNSWSTKILENRWLRFVGRISYSIYLWHVFFFLMASPQAGASSSVLNILSERPWKYLASILMAVTSYYLIEKPFIRLGHRLAPPMTPGHTDLEANNPIGEPYATFSP